MSTTVEHSTAWKSSRRLAFGLCSRCSTESVCCRKNEEVLCCLATSDISEQVYESESDVRESSCREAIIHEYIKTFTSTLIDHNELQSSTCFSTVSIEEYREASDDRNRNTLFGDDTCVPESRARTKFPVLIYLCFKNIPVSKGNSGNTGFAHG
ncbi:hypothetical protein AVEN_79771-1 [Araneus ventricosus]|uniref:Uncharacterized protein n=1 Tax=Araneus ventricosus TaxID=182803 RepID=A0A4Y2RK30_ARAVE|nr:hypothetical protein AVEN_79771-1 [Araneus ventricosus]